MKALLIVLPLLVVGLSSCDKAKQAADAVRSKMGGVTDPGAPAPPGGDVTPDLASQVDSAAEGVRFRRDLPFPAVVKVQVVDRNKFNNARILFTSALGNETASYNGTWETVGTIERSSQRVLLTVEKSGEVMELPDGEKQEGKPVVAGGPAPMAGSDVAGAKIEFELGPKGWRIPPRKGPVDFNNKLLADEILPSLAENMAHHGAMPRPQWFSSSRRWIGGDKLVLEGDSLQLLFPFKGVSGRITLTYEVSEALEGHPCGRFSVIGDVAAKDVVGLSGETSSSEVTINSGKIWCSLIHPVVLREEYQTVLTSVEGTGKGPRFRVQGGVDTLLARRWIP